MRSTDPILCKIPGGFFRIFGYSIKSFSSARSTVKLIIVIAREEAACPPSTVPSNGGSLINQVGKNGFVFGIVCRGRRLESRELADVGHDVRLDFRDSSSVDPSDLVASTALQAHDRYPLLIQEGFSAPTMPGSTSLGLSAQCCLPRWQWQWVKLQNIGASEQANRKSGEHGESKG